MPGVGQPVSTRLHTASAPLPLGVQQDRPEAGRRGLSGVCAATLGPAARVTWLLAVPFGLAAWLVEPFLGAGAAVVCACSVLVYPAALLGHELAHAVLYRSLAQDGAPDVVATAGRWTVHLDRAPLPRHRDIAVTVSGPAAGIVLATSPQLLAWGAGAAVDIHLILAASTTFALHHLGAILPGTADYAALVRALRPTPAPSSAETRPSHHRVGR